MTTLTTRGFDLPLKHVFRISRSAVSVQPTMIVQAAAGGLYGYGEATENDYYQATIENITAMVAKAQPLLDGWAPQDPADVLREVGAVIGFDDGVPGASFAQCAIDCALHDLWGKSAGKPVAELWGLDQSIGPQSNFTIGIDTIPVMVEKLAEEPGWPTYKIKLGTPEDIEIVRELRKHTDARFRVDANCGWTAEKTIELSAELKELGVEFIEQPLPADDRAGMERVFAESALPVIADESCITEPDVARCQDLFHGVNVKLVKCGGLAPARRMLTEARRRGMKTMVGCMTESSVGISAIAQLLPMLDYVDMDGAVLIAQDIASGARVDKGRCVLPGAGGLGVELNDGPLG